MKNKILLLFTVFALISCGKEDTKDVVPDIDDNTENPVGETPEEEPGTEEDPSDCLISMYGPSIVSYDEAKRMSFVKYDNGYDKGQMAFNYDAIGARIVQAETKNTEFVFKKNSKNQIIEIISKDIEFGWETSNRFNYHPNGNLQSWIYSSDSTAFVYDDKGKNIIRTERYRDVGEKIILKIYNFEYDNKINPLKGNLLAAYGFYSVPFAMVFSENNMTKRELVEYDYEDWFTRSYEYNENGYPVFYKEANDNGDITVGDIRYECQE